MVEQPILKATVRERLYRRRFILPNAVTVGNMFCGFLAIVYSHAGRFDKAAYAIAFAILLDGLDGRVARKFNATSKFGVEFDSFSDLVSFGVAPAILVYDWAFGSIADEFGVLIAFVFTICSASRLARFNIAHENLGSFTGLPTPGAAGIIAAIVHMNPVTQVSQTMAINMAVCMPLVGYLMVSRIEFFSIKLLRMEALGLFARILIGALIALIWYSNEVGFLVLAAAYVLSGPLGLLRRKKAPKADAGHQPPAAH